MIPFNWNLKKYSCFGISTLCNIYTQNERPCCIGRYKLEPKARVCISYYPIQHGREYCIYYFKLTGEKCLEIDKVYAEKIKVKVFANQFCSWIINDFWSGIREQKYSGVRLSEILKYCMISGKCHFYQDVSQVSFLDLLKWIFSCHKNSRVLLELLQNVNLWQLNSQRVMFSFKAKK